MQEEDLKFIKWTKLKIRIHLSSTSPRYFKEREVWWASLGANIGFEQDGVNKKFERPVLILKKFNQDMLWVAPLTRAKMINREKDAFKVYYYALDQEGEDSFVVLSQIRTISNKRLTRKMRMIYQNEFEIIKERIRNFLA